MKPKPKREDYETEVSYYMALNAWKRWRLTTKAERLAHSRMMNRKRGAKP